MTAPCALVAAWLVVSLVAFAWLWRATRRAYIDDTGELCWDD